MKSIKKYIKNYRHKKSNREIIENLALFFLASILCFTPLIIIERIFYLSTYSRKNYFILFLIGLLIFILYIIIKWAIKYNAILGFNTDEIIAREIGNKNLSIKDRLLNVIQLEKSHGDLDLTKIAIKNIENDIEQTNNKPNNQISGLKKIYLPIFIGSLVLLIFLNNDIKKAAYRLADYNTQYISPTPFSLTDMSNRISALSGDSINFIIKGIGVLPDSIHFYWKDKNGINNTKISKKNDMYYYTLDGIKSDITYWANYKSYSFFSSWDSIGINPGDISVKQRPSLLNNKFIIDYPGYTNLETAEYIGSNRTQIEAIKGSKVKLIFEADRELESSWMLINDNRIYLTIKNKIIHGDFQLNEMATLQIYCLDKSMTPNLNPVKFSFNIIDDLAPSIIVSTPSKEFEIDESYKIYLNFNINDDYGIKDGWIEYSIVSPGFENNNRINKIPFQDDYFNESKEINITYEWDIDNLGVLMGDEIHFWIAAEDNDPYKIEPTKTNKFIGKFPSLEDLFFEIEDKEEEAFTWLDDIKESIEDISQVTDEVELELLKEDNMSFENEKKLEDSFGKIENIKEEISKVQENIEKIIEQAEKNNLFDQNLIEKFNEFKDMLQDIITPELMEAMEKLQEAMKNMDPEEIAKALENFEFNVEEFENQLDRYIDMFKMAQAEQQLNELNKMIQNIVEKQIELDDYIDDNSTKLNTLEPKADKQEQRYDSFLKLLEQAINEISDVSESTSDMLQSLNENPIIEQTNQNLDEMKKEISKNDRDNASLSSENTQNNCEIIRDEINRIQEEFINEEMQEITNSFIIIINNLLTISNQQEHIISNSQGIRSNSPVIAEINSTQNNINRQLDQVMEKLIILSNKTFFITPPINRAFGKSKVAMTSAMSSFEQKKITTGKKSQKEALQNINLTTQLLMDALNELKDSNSPSGIEQFMESMEQMGQQQQGLNQSTLQLSQLGMMQQQSLLEELQSKQEELKQELEDLLEEFPGANNGTMEKIGQDMEEIIQDFKNKNVTAETILRQKNIVSRMLDNQKSLQQKDFSNKRKSKTGSNFIYTGNDDLPDNLGDRNLLLINAMESAMEEGYSIEYNKLIRTYFLNLQKENAK